jgi:hypothetical protein
MTGIDRRDEALGAALRALPVPEHGAGFADRLRAELRAAPAAGTERGRRRAGGRFAGLGRRAGGRLPARARSGAGGRLGVLRRRGRLTGGLALAGAACVTALALLLPGGTHTPGGTLGVEPATAAQLGATVTRALARVDALSAVLVVRERAASDAPLRTTRARVLLTSAGDVRVEGAERLLAYHADSGVQTALRDPLIPGAVVEEGLAPGPPDRTGDRAVALDLGAVARALRAAGRAPVREVRVAGRPAWRIVLPAAIDVHALPGDSGDRVDVAVDRASGIPLRVRETYRGRFVREQRLERIRLDPAIPAGAFALVAPGDALRLDAGFERSTLGAARGAIGYAPLAPRWLPAGFARAETAVAVATDPTGAEAMNPPSRDVVSTAYRRGLQTVVVTTRRVGADPRAWTDPLAAGEGFLVRPQQICFTRGALAGRCGQQLVAPRALPHVWAVAGGLVVTVAGDLTAPELRRAAESLAPVP